MKALEYISAALAVAVAAALIAILIPFAVLAALIENVFSKKRAQGPLMGTGAVGE